MPRPGSGLISRRTAERRAAARLANLDAITAPDWGADRVAASTVIEITDAIDTGAVALSDVVAWEQAGRQRKGILALDPNNAED